MCAEFFFFAWTKLLISLMPALSRTYSIDFCWSSSSLWCSSISHLYAAFCLDAISFLAVCSTLWYLLLQGIVTFQVRSLCVSMLRCTILTFFNMMSWSLFAFSLTSSILRTCVSALSFLTPRSAPSDCGSQTALADATMSLSFILVSTNYCA